MAAGAWTFTDGARTRLLNGTFDLDTDTFLMALFLSTSNIGALSLAAFAPVVTSTVRLGRIYLGTIRLV